MIHSPDPQLFERPINILVAGELLFPPRLLRFPILLPFFDAQPGRSFHPTGVHLAPPVLCSAKTCDGLKVHESGCK